MYSVLVCDSRKTKTYQVLSKRDAVYNDTV